MITSNPLFGHTASETRSQVLERMARKAADEGVKIAQMAGNPKVWVALSTGKTNTAYMVRPGNREAGCECRGYRQHGYCKHYAAVVVAAGIMPAPAPEPKVLDQFTCHECLTRSDTALNFGMCDACFETNLQMVDALRGYDLALDLAQEDEYNDPYAPDC